MQNAECKMQNERRLIDGNKAQAVLVNMAEHLLEAGNPEMAGAVGYAAEVIGKQPTVDAVEVVRCKTCKFWSDGIAGYTDHVKVCKIGFYMVGENGYCVFGERREGA